MVVVRYRKSDSVLIIALIILLSVTGFCQKRFHGNSVTQNSENLNYLPSGKFLKGLALGYDEALADLLWVRTVGYFGLHAKTDQDFTWLKHMLKLATILDPRYESPYEFAAVILPNVLDDPEGAVVFLKKGIENIPKHNPRYWLQPFYLGFCYMIYLDEPAKAAKYFSIAARYPQSPKYLPLLVSRLHASQNRPELGISIVQDFLNDPDSKIMQNEHFRKALENRLKALIVAMHLDYLDSAVSEYVLVYHEKPALLSDLVDSLIVPFVPEEPNDGYYYYDKIAEKVLSSKENLESETNLDIKTNIRLQQF